MTDTKGTNDVMDNQTSITLVGILVFIVIIVLLVRFFIGGGRTSAVTNGTEITRPAPSCETWGMYGFLPDSFPGGIFEIESGQTFVLRLKPNKPSGWVKFKGRSWTIPTNLTYIGFPDGMEIEETRQNYRNIKLGRHNKLRFRGEGCELLTASEAVKRRWY